MILTHLPLDKMAAISQTIFISPVSEGSGDVMVLRRSRPPRCSRDNSKTTGWIVLKFGIHIGSDSVLT